MWDEEMEEERGFVGLSSSFNRAQQVNDLVGIVTRESNRTSSRMRPRKIVMGRFQENCDDH
jgi:hypothetical protein